MATEIRINHPSDGEWIMLRCGGVFNGRTDHSIAVHREGRIQGGVVYTGYIGSAIMLHMAGIETNWATRDFLIMVFDYAFNQLGVRKVVGMVEGRNERALSIDFRLGFRFAAALEDVYPDHGPLYILTMTKDQCKWLGLRMQGYRAGGSGVEFKTVLKSGAEDV